MYEVMVYVGYFFIMFIFMVLAVIFANKIAGWILYLVGGLLQLLPMIGSQKQATLNQSNITTEWVIYIGLLLVTLLIIVLRRRRAAEKERKRIEEMAKK